MKALILLLAAYANQSMPLAIASQQTPAQHMLQTLDVQDAWQFACKIMQAPCEEQPPKVIAASLFREYGALGVYSPMEGGQFPEDTVVLDSDLAPYLDHVYVQATLAHEFTHYIDHVYRGLEAKENCPTEWNAWRVDNAYLIVHGRQDLTDYTWPQRYGCFGAEESIDE